MKYLCTIVLSLLMFFEATAQVASDTITTKDLFARLEKIENVKDVKINSFMMSMARLTARGSVKEFLNQIKTMRMFGFDECSASDKTAFDEYISAVEIREFDKVEEVSESGIRSVVFVGYGDDCIEEVIVATLSEEICAMIYMKGELSEEMLLRMSQGEFAPPQ